MGTVTDEIRAFEAMRAQLEAEHLGQWVLIYRRELIGSYVSFETAAEVAVERFGSGPFLIRQVGAPPITLPVSVMYHRVEGQH
jgi:hypothetical protein